MSIFVVSKGYAFRKAPINLSQFAELDFFICQNGQYVQTMAFAKYQAYWVRSDEEQAIVYDCDETRGGDEIVITSEWQFIGISDEESVGMDRTNLECQKWQEGCFQKVEAQEPLELGRGYLMRKCE